jgi:cyclic beta-1,2-glucan synthetase
LVGWRQPAGCCADEYQAELRPDRGVLRRRDGDIETLYEVAVVPDADAEVRRVTLLNHGKRTRTLEITSYAEVALNPRPADQAHPAFAKLFLETEHLSPVSALLCRRRPRSRDQQPVWALHALAGPEDVSMICGDVQFETDRACFLGRGRTTANPAALETRSLLSGTIGPVLDPVFCLRRVVRLVPGASVAFAFTTGRPEDR